MGENGSRRFGAHLRRLREDRRLTLDRIEELSLTYRTRISKSYLSRCETGTAAPNLERLSVLSKIYNTDLGLLIERHEAERELEQLPPVDLTGRSFEELQAEGVDRAQHGHLKAAYSIFSAAQDLLILEGDSDAGHRRAKVRLSLSIVLSQMGKYELACAEASEITRMVELDQELIDKALLQLAVCHHRTGRYHLSRIVVEGLERRIDELPMRDQGNLLLLAGSLHYRMNSIQDAIKKARKAATAFRKAKDKLGESRALHNTGRYYMVRGDAEKAIGFLNKGLELVRKLDMKSEIAWQLADLAKAYIMIGAMSRARALIQDSMELARNGDYHDVMFADYFHLWRMAVDLKDEIAAASMLRSLRKLLPRVESTLEEAEEFRRLTHEDAR